MTDEICQLCGASENKNLTKYHLDKYHGGLSMDDYLKQLSADEAPPEEEEAPSEEVASEEETEEEPEEAPEKEPEEESDEEPIEEFVDDTEYVEEPVETVEIDEQPLYFSMRKYNDTVTGWSFDPDTENPKPIPRAPDGKVPISIAKAIQAGYIKRK